MLKSPDVTEVEIPQDLLAEFEALPDTKQGPPGFPFTEVDDALILRFFETKNKTVLAEKIGCCEHTLRKRYRQLTGK